MMKSHYFIFYHFLSRMFQLIFEPYLKPMIRFLNKLSDDSQIIATSTDEHTLNGPNFIDNTFRSSVTSNGMPKIERVANEPFNQTR